MLIAPKSQKNKTNVPLKSKAAFGLLLLFGATNGVSANLDNTVKSKLPAYAVAKKAQTKVKPDTSDKKPEASKEKPVIIPKDTVDINCLDLVNDPKKYLDKHVRFKTRFYAFSSLALDYKPAMRSSKDYLSILVLRDDSHTPLSELKLAVPMSKDNTTFNKMLGTLKDGDKIEIVGTEFSMALGDPWVDVIDLKRLEPPKPDKDDEDDVVDSDDLIEKKKNKEPNHKKTDSLPPEINEKKK